MPDMVEDIKDAAKGLATKYQNLATVKTPFQKTDPKALLDRNQQYSDQKKGTTPKTKAAPKMSAPKGGKR